MPIWLGQKPRGSIALGSLGTGGAAVWAPYPAPSGFRWDFVTSNGDRVTSNGEPVVALVEIA